jgi:hypothetical protein
MTRERLDKRLDYLKRIAKPTTPSSTNRKAANYEVMEDARDDGFAVKKPSILRTRKNQALAAYQPEIAQGQLSTNPYYYGGRWKLAAVGAAPGGKRRAVHQVSTSTAVKGFDMHENAASPR